MAVDRMPCPKCGAFSGDDWEQCKGSCPMPGSPHYKKPPNPLVQWLFLDKVSAWQVWASALTTSAATLVLHYLTRH